jgi:hypothetical protein
LRLKRNDLGLDPHFAFNMDNMTSETDDQSERRPPTIELKATEIGGAAEQPGDAAAGASGAAEQESAPRGNDSPPSRPAARFAPHIGSALLGALVMAGVAAALWFTDAIPSHETAAIPSHETAPVAAPPSLAPQPTAPAGNPPSSSPAGSPQVPAANGQPGPDVAARLDKLERAIEAQHGDPALNSRIADIAAQTKSLTDNLAALTRRVDDAAAASQSAGKQADTALNAAAAAKSTSEAASKEQVPREDVDALARRIMALESAVKGLAATTAPLVASGVNDRTARLTVAAEALRAAVERGAPYQAELSAVQSLGVDQKATAALNAFAASGVPTAAALARELEALIPSLQDASEPRSGDTNFVERLKSNAQKLVRITPLNTPPGSDPQTVVDRIRVDAARADIGAAVSDVNALPDAAKSLASDWSKKAAARDAALAASRKIAADALAALTQSGVR